MSDDLQFEKAEYKTPESQQCAICANPFVARYWVANGKPVCADCHQRIVGHFNVGTPGGRFMAALGLGTAAAALGAGLYYAVRAITGYDVGLVGIVVGLIVGAAVKRGARGRGGAGYQALAMGLTYLSIAAAYFPTVLSELNPASHPIAGSLITALAVIISLGAPIMLIFRAPISGLIAGFALYEAWKVNKRPKLDITGPHLLPPAPAPAPSPPSVPPSDG
jgi:hypothetical protein